MTENQFIDTHNHFMVDAWSDGHEKEFEKAVQAGVRQMLICAGGVDNFELTKSFAHRFGCGYAVGLHPLYIRPEVFEEDLKAFREFVLNNQDDPHLVGIGEIGLDGSEDCSVPMPIQEKVLREQLKLARRLDFGVSLHGRKAIDLVTKHVAVIKVRGILHAFNGSERQAERLLSLGLKLGYGGAMTYSGSRRIRWLLSQLPAHSWVLETDAPDIPGEAARNLNPEEPTSSVADIAVYAELAAELREEPLSKVSADTTANALEVFPKLGNLEQMHLLP